MFILPVLMLGACQVSKDDANDSATVQYNQDLAENVAADVTSQAGAIAGHISNDVQEAGATVSNEVGKVDVDVDVNRDAGAQANADANAN
jgi:hypothetical protein